MPDRIDPAAFADVSRGYVMAPAGCGKTESILALASAEDQRRTLILTHTNAGVAALQARAAKRGVPSRQFRVCTLDGWAVQLSAMFPKAVGDLPPVDQSDEFYPALRRAVLRLVQGKALREPLRATYGRVLVDEYQDCSIEQHQLILALAQHLPVCVFGDPLQAIFDFGGVELVDWERDVEGNFQRIGTLDFPWRWQRVGNRALGDWLLQVRQAVMDGAPLDLMRAPNCVRWQQLTGSPRNDRVMLVRTAAYEGRQYAESVLIIADAVNVGGRHRLARDARGVNVVEPVELKDVTQTARLLAQGEGKQKLECLLNFAKSVMTAVDVASLLRRCDVLLKGRARTSPSIEEAHALAVVQDGSPRTMHALLHVLRSSRERRVFRATALSALLETLNCADCGKAKDLVEAAAIVRERRRSLGQRLSRRAVGSTLLLKGLEAEHVIVLDADRLPPKHLYVALTRATKSLTVFSQRAHLLDG